MESNTTTELTKVLLPTPEALLRYLRRLEERYYTEFKNSTTATFRTAMAKLDAVEAAIRNFSPAAHMEAVRARNMAG